MRTTPDFDLYQELGIPSDAGPEQIREAYLKLARIFHSDSGLAPDHDRMVRLNQAYRILTVPQDRMDYDHFRRGQGTYTNPDQAPPRRPQPASPTGPTPSYRSPESEPNPNFISKIPGWVWGIGIIAAISFGVSYFNEQDQRGSIANQNQAASLSAATIGTGVTVPNTQSGTSTQGSSSTIDVFDMRVGDCIQQSPASEVVQVTKLPCTSPLADFRVTHLFAVSSSTLFPGDAYFDRQVDQRCPSNTVFFFTPTEQSWTLGDRTVTCLARTR